MTARRLIAVPALFVAGGLAALGCGSGSNQSQSVPPSSSPPPSGPTGGGPPTSAAPGALTPDAASAATGDIPDNQVFLTYHDRVAGYAMRYPEGWARTGSGLRVTFRDKNNLIRVAVSSGALPSPAAAAAEAGAGGARAGPGSRITLGSGRAVRVRYTTTSPPNPVTGKRVVLSVDRYYLARAGRRAVVDLGTPRGVDNVDAYRLIIQSFRWR